MKWSCCLKLITVGRGWGIDRIIMLVHHCFGLNVRIYFKMSCMHLPGTRSWPAPHISWVRPRVWGTPGLPGGPKGPGAGADHPHGSATVRCWAGTAEAGSGPVPLSGAEPSCSSPRRHTRSQQHGQEGRHNTGNSQRQMIFLRPQRQNWDRVRVYLGVIRPLKCHNIIEGWRKP